MLILRKFHSLLDEEEISYNLLVKALNDIEKEKEMGKETCFSENNIKQKIFELRE